ncbi:hemagglutinin repeat-containing protein [Methylobacterium sp. J-076]|nr:hemagglutinin repeat-containing protein [Methylobacterium sp. J-076]
MAAGGDLTVEAGGALSVLGSTLVAGGDARLTAAGPVTIAATLDTATTTSLTRKDGWFSSKTTRTSRSDSTSQASEIAAGGALTLVSGADLTVTASHLTAGGDLALTAAGSLALLGGQDRHSAAVSTSSSGFGLFGGGGGLDLWRSKRIAGSASSVENAATLLTAGRDATLTAGQDLTVTGSAVSAAGLARLTAGRDLVLAPGDTRTATSTARRVAGIGLTGSLTEGGLSLGAGTHSATTRTGAETTGAAPSSILGGAGVVLAAGRDATLTGADLASGADLTVSAGRDLALLAARETSHAWASRSRTAIGLTLAIGQNITGALDQLRGAVDTATSGQGGAGYRAVGVASGAMQAIDGALALSHPSLSASLTLGAAHSQSRSESASEAQRPTTLSAAGDVSLTAGRDLRLQGTQGQAGGRMDLAAGRDLTVESAVSRTASAQSASAWKAGLGLGASLGLDGASAGITADAALSRSQGQEAGSTNLNAHLTAGTGLSLTSGRDTTVAGAVVRAPEIAVAVGGDLTVASRQDTTQGGSTSRHLSGGITLGVGTSPSSGSLSLGGGRSTTDRAWVGEQTALLAGDRLSVSVGGHTGVDGAVIASGTGHLSLDTGTLSVTDLSDHDRGRSLALTLGATVTAGGGSDQTANGSQGPPATTPDGRPVGASISGRIANADREGVSRGTIGAGTITLRDPDHQGQDVAAINRDVGRAQAVTRDTRSGVSFYGSSSALGEAAGGFQGIRAGVAQIGRAAREGFKDLPAQVQARVKEVAKQVGLAGRTPEGAIDAMVDALVAKGDIPADQADAAKQTALRALLDNAQYTSLTSGAVGGLAPTTTGWVAGVAGAASRAIPLANVVVQLITPDNSSLDTDKAGATDDGTKVSWSGKADETQRMMTLTSSDGTVKQVLFSTTPSGDTVLTGGRVISASGIATPLDADQAYEIAQQGGKALGIAVTAGNAGVLNADIQENNETGKNAEKEVNDGLRAQGAKVTGQVTVVGSDGTRCRPDCVIEVPDGKTAEIPPGSVLEDLNGKPVVNEDGTPVTMIPTDSKGRAVIEVKSGNGRLTDNQAGVLPEIAQGTATGVGGRAREADIIRQFPTMPAWVIRIKGRN